MNYVKKNQISVGLKNSKNVLIIIFELDLSDPSNIECPYMSECVNRSSPRAIKAFSRNVQNLISGYKKSIFSMVLIETLRGVSIIVEGNENLNGELICCTIRCPIEVGPNCKNHDKLPCIPRSQRGPVLKMIRQIASEGMISIE